MDIDIRDLQMVAAIAASGSVTRAAGELHLTQSAVSHQLRAIEERLGTPLFLRAGKAHGGDRRGRTRARHGAACPRGDQGDRGRRAAPGRAPGGCPARLRAVQHRLSLAAAAR